MRRRGKSVLLACLLFALSGAALAYNIWTAEGGDVAVSISDLVDQMRDGDIAVGAYPRENTEPAADMPDNTDDTTSDAENAETTSRAPLPPVVRREEG